MPAAWRSMHAMLTSWLSSYAAISEPESTSKRSIALSARSASGSATLLAASSSCLPNSCRALRSRTQSHRKMM